jgi:hypothetical protein
MNILIKKVLASIESEVRTSGKIPNWTNLLGRVVAAVNNQKGRSPYAETAYKSVFVQDNHLPVKCSMSKIRECNTIEDRLCVSKDS